jgi:hypothetical protein
MQGRSVGLCRTLMFGLSLMLFGDAAFAQTKSLHQFAIAAQPLASALSAYGAASGLEIFYDGELAIGRHSSAVIGLRMPEDALRELLVGTGLVTRSTGPDRFTITAASPSRAANVTYQSYFSAVETRVSQALCRRAETRPGDSDTLLRIWIASSGIVQRTQFLDPADDRGSEKVFAGALSGLSIGGVPPPGMPQPVIVAILARTAGQPSGCIDSATMAGR